MKSNVQIQQGDVCLERVDLPVGVNLKRVEPRNGRLILVDGEHTGHAHEVRNEDIGGVALLEAEDKRLFLQVEDKPVTVVHPEHGPVTVPPGVFEVGRVYEHDYLRNMRRQVQD